MFFRQSQIEVRSSLLWSRVISRSAGGYRLSQRLQSFAGGQRDVATCDAFHLRQHHSKRLCPGANRSRRPLQSFRDYARTATFGSELAKSLVVRSRPWLNDASFHASAHGGADQVALSKASVGIKRTISRPSNASGLIQINRQPPTTPLLCRVELTPLESAAFVWRTPRMDISPLVQSDPRVDRWSCFGTVL